MSGRTDNIEPNSPLNNRNLPNDITNEKILFELLNHIPFVLTNLMTNGSPGSNVVYTEDRTGIKIPFETLIGEESFESREGNFRILSHLLNNIDLGTFIQISDNQRIVTFDNAFHSSTELGSYYIRIEFYNIDLPDQGIAISLEKKLVNIKDISSPEIPIRALRNGLCHLESLATIYFHKPNALPPGHPTNHISHASQSLIRVFAGNYWELHHNPSAMLFDASILTNTKNNRPFTGANIQLVSELKGTWHGNRRITPLDLMLNSTREDILKSYLIYLSEEYWNNVSNIQIILAGRFKFPYGDTFSTFLYRVPSKEKAKVQNHKRSQNSSWVRVFR